jgi:hypothetical protein
MASVTNPGKTRRSAKTDDAVLPFPVRQRLWDQLWQRLLAPPIEEGDRADSKSTEPRHGEGR